MEMIPINSDKISSIGFDESTNIMRIKFRHGDTYDYIDVQSFMYESLQESTFIDLFFINMFENKYTCQKVNP